MQHGSPKMNGRPPHAVIGLSFGIYRDIPIPVVENLATLSLRVIAFVVAMIAGMALRDSWQKL
jgi:hypothetical protein